MRRRNSVKLYLILAFGLITLQLMAQIDPVTFEAESGDLGGDFELKVGAITYITCTTNSAEQYPENENRVVTYTIEFPQAGTYDLYARLKVGTGGSDDDSFFYGNGFGEKDTTNADEWITINNIASGGYLVSNDVVDGEGTEGTEVWKWLNLSECSKQETPTTFTVTEGNLAQVLQLGAREDGLGFDKFAFGLADQALTVAELESGKMNDPDNNGGNNGADSDHPIAHGKPKFLGNIYSNSQAPGFADYWNQVTPENAGKWGSVERSRDNMSWSELDKAYKLAKDNDFPFKLHVLVWGSQQPAWMENLSTGEQYEEIVEWFNAVAERYPDIDMIEVVNEPLHQPPSGAGTGNYINALGGSGASGWDWVLTAFRLARDIFPNSQLLINDYGIIGDANAVNRYLKIVNLLKNENLVDGIGFQAHAFSTRGTAATMKSNLDKLATAGLPLYATELDIDGPTDQQQLNDYKRIFPVFWDHPSVEGITLWGYRPGLWRNEQKAYIINADGSERPAMQWLKNYVADSYVGINPVETNLSIQVYPNPVINKVVTLTGIETITTIHLLDLNGKEIKAQNIRNEAQMQFDLSVDPGIYFLRFEGKTGSFVRKVVVH